MLIYFSDELDSYMYQTVGHQGINLYAEAMDLPLYRETISGSAVDRGRNYKPTDNDEVEDLYRLLSRVKVSKIIYLKKIAHVRPHYVAQRYIQCCMWFT